MGGRGPATGARVAEADSPPLRVALAGAGAMGRNHARLLAELPEVELVGVWDVDAETASTVAAAHDTGAIDDGSRLAELAEAVVVAAPTAVHAEIGCGLLERGVHVLMEKPMAASLDEADRLLAAAERGARDGRQPVLAVGHVEFFNPAVQALLADRAPVRFVEVQRLSVFSPRSLDVDVILDLMIHDLQILHALDPSPLAEVRATGIDVLSDRVDIANARLAFESGAVANVTASRVSSERVRKLRVFSPSRYLSLDYREQEIKGYRLVEDGGDRRIVPADLPIERQEPLRAELAAFAAACRGRPASYVDGRAGRQALATALAVAEAITDDPGRANRGSSG